MKVKSVLIRSLTLETIETTKIGDSIPSYVYGNIQAEAMVRLSSGYVEPTRIFLTEEETVQIHALIDKINARVMAE